MAAPHALLLLFHLHWHLPEYPHHPPCLCLIPACHSGDVMCLFLEITSVLRVGWSSALSVLGLSMNVCFFLTVEKVELERLRAPSCSWNSCQLWARPPSGPLCVRRALTWKKPSWKAGTVTLVGSWSAESACLWGSLPLGSLPLGVPAFGGPCLWGPCLWGPCLLHSQAVDGARPGQRGSQAGWCHIREMWRLRSCRDASSWLLSQLFMDGLSFFPTAMWDVCGTWSINAPALNCSCPPSESLSYSWFPPWAPALPQPPCISVCPAPRSPWQLSCCGFVENHPWELAPGTATTHLSPGEASGRHGAWIKRVWERSWQHDEMETHSRENASCQKRSWHLWGTITHSRAGKPMRDHGPQVTCTGTGRWREKVSRKPEDAKRGRGKPVRGEKKQRKWGSKEWQRSSPECDHRLLCCCVRGVLREWM